MPGTRPPARAGGTADTTTNGGTTAFSTATDTASLTVAAGSISGYVYIDADNCRPAHHFQRRDECSVSRASSLHFSNSRAAALGPRRPRHDGRRRLVPFQQPGRREHTKSKRRSQPPIHDGKDTVGTIGGVTTGTARTDQFTDHARSGRNGSEYNFGEWGLTPGMISLRMCLASAPSGAQIVMQLRHRARGLVSRRPTAGSGVQHDLHGGGSPVAIAARAPRSRMRTARCWLR